MPSAIWNIRNNFKNNNTVINMSAIKLGRSLIWWIITVAFDVIILNGNLWQAGAARHGGDVLGSPSVPRPLSSRCGSQAARGSAHTQAKSSSICLLAKQVGGVSQTGSLNTLTSQQKRCTLPRSGPPQQQPVSPPRCHHQGVTKLELLSLGRGMWGAGSTPPVAVTAAALGKPWRKLRFPPLPEHPEPSFSPRAHADLLSAGRNETVVSRAGECADSRLQTSPALATADSISAQKSDLFFSPSPLTFKYNK